MPLQSVARKFLLDRKIFKQSRHFEGPRPDVHVTFNSIHCRELSLLEDDAGSQATPVDAFDYSWCRFSFCSILIGASVCELLPAEPLKLTLVTIKFGLASRFSVLLRHYRVIASRVLYPIPFFRSSVEGRFRTTNNICGLSVLATRSEIAMQQELLKCPEGSLGS